MSGPASTEFARNELVRKNSARIPKRMVGFRDGMPAKVRLLDACKM